MATDPKTQWESDRKNGFVNDIAWDDLDDWNKQEYSRQQAIVDSVKEKGSGIFDLLAGAAAIINGQLPKQ